MTKQQRKFTFVTGTAATLITMALLCGVHSSAHRDNSNLSDSDAPSISPAGTLLMDATTRQPAVGALPVDFVRSPDHTGPDQLGRYLISVNSGFGIQFNAGGNRAQQSLSVIDLNASPSPVVIQNVYFPTPQSVNVGVVFSPKPDDDGLYPLYVSGGFENRIWIFRLRPGDKTPITPLAPTTLASSGASVSADAPFIDINSFGGSAPSPRYNRNHAPVYPTGLAISPDGNTLFVANNLGDSLGIITDLRGARKLQKIPLPGKEHQSDPQSDHYTYPYAVVAIPHGPLVSRALPKLDLVPNPAAAPRRSGPIDPLGDTAKVYVSCWNDSSVAVVNFSARENKTSYITVGEHPTAMLWDGTHGILYVVNSGDDTVSLIDTGRDREIERIRVRLAEKAPPGNTPEGLALNGGTLYVANAHSNSVAVIKLLNRAGGKQWSEGETDRSTIRGFIPTGNYPSAVTFVDHLVFVGNGKGTGVETSSVVVNNSGRNPNYPNDRFPAGSGRGSRQGGQYSVSVVTGNLGVIAEPDDKTLARYTQQVMRNNGLIGAPVTRLFSGTPPIKHVIYVIKENRTYDQVLGDVKQSGDGTPADGDADLAIFGGSDAAKSALGEVQDIAPNHRALALRFGLFDRFFVNSEASPDGHNWSTAAFSSDYVDKAYRWNYSDRGRGYDFEGFNRLPEYEPMRTAPPLFGPSTVAEDVTSFMQRYIPYLHGSRDVAEPETLYLWDAAARAGLTYRNYGEFVATLSESDITAIRKNRAKIYPDLSPNVSAFATKKALEGHFSVSFRNFDLNTPDAMTVESYGAAKASAGSVSPLISNASGQKFPGTSRLGAWLEEFRNFVADREAGKPDQMPNLSIVRFSNDHTDGLSAGKPTPQFFVADNDYAVGLLVDIVSHSPYWKDTAIVTVEDDAQDGPDHVDAHRSVALVISAYNRPGRLIHDFHNTVSLVRTIELLVGIAPMNQLDANAIPMDIFQAQPDLGPYSAVLPNVALDNLLTPRAADSTIAYWMNRSSDLDMSHSDMADPRTLNQIIWFSVRGKTPLPAISRLPAFDVMKVDTHETLEEKRAMARATTVDRD